MAEGSISALHLMLGLLLILGLLGAISWYLLRRRRHIWYQFAKKYGLRFHARRRGGPGPRVSGQFRGRRISLTTRHPGSDTGELGAEEVRMSMELRGPLPPLIRITEKDLGKDSTPSQTAVRDDPDFDAKVHAESQNTEQLRTYLTPSRRSALEKLLSLGDPGKSGLESPEIFLIEREILSSESHLEERFQQLLEIARELDGSTQA